MAVKAFLIAGMPHSGNRLLRSILIRCGCAGSSDGYQPTQHAMPRPKRPYVVHVENSVARWIRWFRDAGFEPHVLCLVRESIALARSEYADWGNRIDIDRVAIKQARFIRNAMNDAVHENVTFELVSYEALCEPMLAEWIPTLGGLEYTQVWLAPTGQKDRGSIVNQNAKHYHMATCPYPVRTRHNGFYWAVNPAIPRCGLDLSNHEDWIYQYLRVPKNRVFLDVGAFVGSHAIRVALQEHCKVIAVEPLPEHIEMIQINARLNKAEIRILPVAAGEDECDVLMVSDGGNSAVVASSDRPTRTVRQVRLDNVLTESDDIGLIKIDVEGAEVRVLHGAVDIVARNRPVIIIEVHSHLPGFGNNGNLIVSWCRIHGYSWRRIWQNTEAYYYVQLTPT